MSRSILSQLTTPETRSDVLAWYVTTSTLGSSLGSEASGRIIHFLQSQNSWTSVDAYHSLFWIYTVMGIVNALLVLLLTDACELSTTEDMYTQVPQNEDETAGSANQDDAPETEQKTQSAKTLLSKTTSWFTMRLAQISGPTRAIMYKLWFLLALDSLADGMVPYSLTNYYLDNRFHPTKSTLGDITSVSYFLSAIGAVFAGPLARKIGLINTMVFTHVPSSAAVLFFPFPPVLWIVAGLLMVRAGLNNMDQAPRSAFIAAVVKPEERTATMGITSMIRTLAAMAGPTVTGLMADKKLFWIAFVVAGACRLTYDLGLYAMFVNMKLYQHENKPNDFPAEHGTRCSQDEEMVELQSLADSVAGSIDDGDRNTGSRASITHNRLQVVAASERVRSRSPHTRSLSSG